MNSTRPCRRWIASLAAILLVAQTACGTLLYPERHGRRTGRVDPAVLVLDGILLVFFVIPGLVAFAIDFYTGSVYMTDGRGRAVRTLLDPRELTEARIEALVRDHAGRAIRLGDPALERFRVPVGTDAAVLLERVAAAASDPSWQRADRFELPAPSRVARR